MGQNNPRNPVNDINDEKDLNTGKKYQLNRYVSEKKAVFIP